MRLVHFYLCLCTCHFPLLEYSPPTLSSIWIHFLLQSVSLLCAQTHRTHLCSLVNYVYISYHIIFHLQVEGRDHAQLIFIVPASSTLPEM